MIARWGAPVVVAAMLGGCTGSSAPSPPTTPPTAGSVTVTATVTPPPATPSGSVSSPVATGPARCDAPALTVSLAPSQGAAGTAYFAVVFRNGGEQPCFLQGFPGVSAADAAGIAQVDAARDTARAPVRVVLQPGQAAHAVLAVGRVPSGSTPCPTFPLLLVTPPDSRRTQRITTDLAPCGRRLRIGVVLPGESVS